MSGGYGPAYQVNYHNSHVSWADHDPDAAYTYILKTLAGIDNDVQHPLYRAAFFLKAKILYSKRLYAESLRSYQQLIHMKGLDSVLMANCYTALGESYLEQGDNAAALKYFGIWEKLFAAKADVYNLKSVYHNIALGYLYQQQYPAAEAYFKKSLQLEDQVQDTTGLAISYMDLANLYYMQYQDDKAIPLFEKGLAYAKHSTDLEVLRNAYKNMAVVEENRKHYTQAIQYRKQYEDLQDTIYNRDRLWELARQERKLALQQREHTIQVLGWQRNSLLIAAVALMLLGTAIWFAYRQQTRSKRIITRQKEALNVLNQTKDRLFSIVAHDLRSPVYRLKANLAKLKKAIWQQEITQAAALAASNEKIAGSTYILMDNLLHWALSQTDQLFFRPEELHLRTVVNLVCHDVTPLAADKNISIKQVIPEEIIFMADLHSFKIIVRNVMDNAIKFTPVGGYITVSACLQQDECHIKIIDTGMGMSSDTLAALFDANRKRVQQDTHGYESTGLGLWLCKTMTEKNNGQLTVTSEQEKGTTVTISLPAKT
ncbi:MAG TPA: tetratricopeptide repeat-containing sensor histidine kinase [Chitinophaga sp.]|uniref:ATP-binding protein n=1 Tax=Chitinophaga sp. TaxID=1869181 RepID=UPI002DB9B96A|nr:tetratricopeptide repeat-containing sensor histidine kinase [Chitinophaga sp.]HEU4551902.1 tetratricopeptide repeat-containing sensor histidine kinase [Chitinophaga sp.]